MNNSTPATNVIPFTFGDHAVRVVNLDGQPWFVATDVCKILKQSNTTKALYALDDDERSNFKLGRQGMVNIVNESGLYTLILRCDEAVRKGSQAHAFRKWVTSEVLPQIRKTGRFDGGGIGLTERFLISTDWKGDRQITPVPTDAYVLTLEQFTKGMFVDCDIPVSTEQMFGILAAASENLRRRSLQQAHLLSQAKRAVA